MVLKVKLLFWNMYNLPTVIQNGINRVWKNIEVKLIKHIPLCFSKMTLSCHIHSPTESILNIFEYHKLRINPGSPLAHSPPHHFLFLCLFRSSPLPIELARLALNERCLYWAYRQSISRELSPVAACLSHTVLEGAERSGGIWGYLRIHLSQSEGALKSWTLTGIGQILRDNYVFISCVIPL